MDGAVAPFMFAIHVALIHRIAGVGRDLEIIESSPSAKAGSLQLVSGRHPDAQHGLTSVCEDFLLEALLGSALSGL